MSAIDHIMEHVDEINKAIEVIATFTESGAKATEEISSKMNTLQQHFEKTKQMTFKTGKSLYTAGQGVNEIRKNAVKSVKSPTRAQKHEWMKPKKKSPSG